MTGQGVKTFNVPNRRDWVLSLAQRGYGFGPLAGTLQHLAIRLFVGHSLIARLNGPLQPKSGSDPCSHVLGRFTHTQPHVGATSVCCGGMQKEEKDAEYVPRDAVGTCVRRKLLH